MHKYETYRGVRIGTREAVGYTVLREYGVSLGFPWLSEWLGDRCKGAVTPGGVCSCWTGGVARSATPGASPTRAGRQAQEWGERRS